MYTTAVQLTGVGAAVGARVGAGVGAAVGTYSKITSVSTNVHQFCPYCTSVYASEKRNSRWLTNDQVIT